VVHNGIGEVTSGQQVEIKRGEKKPEKYRLWRGREPNKKTKDSSLIL
jgi:hypothetical protein